MPSLGTRDSRAVEVTIEYDDPVFEPKYKTDGAACCDLVANIPEDGATGRREIQLMPSNSVIFDCGFRMALPAGWEAQVRCRTSMAKKGIIVTNAPGTIDADYRGRMKCMLTNVCREIVVVRHLDRVGQMKLSPVWYFKFKPGKVSVDETDRGEGAFGSTGE